MEEEQAKRKNKQIKLMIIGIAIFVIGLVGVTYTFFNYTRTGLVNNIGTGRIYFYSNQGNSLNLTNLFPMASNEISNANLDSITVNVVGDTTYSDGEEFLVSIVDVNNTITSGSTEKVIPINYVATYAPTAVATGEDPNTIGTSSNNYWDVRNSKNANIYLLNATGEIKENKQILVGYIKNDNTGINGTLTIKAYLDTDKIAISDTYPESEPGELILNPNMTQEELNLCITYVTEEWQYKDDFGEGETGEAFCNGTGTSYGATFDETIANDWFVNVDIEFFLEHNIILQKNYTDDTASEWVNGRTVLTTDEWNSLQNTPISFKIRAESNEGIWVEEPARAPTMDEMCPDCVFTYTTTTSLWTTWNTNSQTPTVLTSSDYEENYEDVITSSGKNFFLGLKLNGSNQIEKAYACGLYNGTTPFCIEGYYDDSKYEANQEILQNEYLWNNTCNEYLDANTGYGYDYTECLASSAGLVGAGAYSDGYVYADEVGDCRASSYGLVYCRDASH